MSAGTWVIIVIIAAMFIGNFILCCPDRLPWNRRKKK